MTVYMKGKIERFIETAAFVTVMVIAGVMAAAFIIAGVM